jgi:ribosomal protein S18 acetylase RimI-like enzyme
VPPGIEILTPLSDADLWGMLVAQNEAYGGAPPDADAVARQKASVMEGVIAALARDATTHEPAGGGVCSVPDGGVTEVAGIGVRSPFRRRGIAGALTSFLVQQAHQVGVELPFLMADNEAAERLYRRAGFSSVGEVLLISRPNFSSP